jgi:toxin ParE1/3/4
MMIMWLDDAVHDLRSLQQYITSENPSAANRIAKRILESVNLLIEQPAMGRPGRVHNTRELVIVGTPFIIPYRVKNKNIEILRVFHSAMQWPEEI